MANNQKSPPRDLDEDESLSSSQPFTNAASTAAVRTEPVPMGCPPDHHAGWLGAGMFSESAWEQIGHSLNFSRQELQIVRGVFDDHTEAAIADRLKISPHTVHTHSERLYRKLGVTGRVKLALRVMEEYIALTLAPESLLPPLCANFASGRCPFRFHKVRVAPDAWLEPHLAPAEWERFVAGVPIARHPAK